MLTQQGLALQIGVAAAILHMQQGIIRSPHAARHEHLVTIMANNTHKLDLLDGITVLWHNERHRKHAADMRIINMHMTMIIQKTLMQGGPADRALAATGAILGQSPGAPSPCHCGNRRNSAAWAFARCSMNCTSCPQQGTGGNCRSSEDCHI